MGCVGEVTGEIVEQLFIPVIEDKTRPVSSSSISAASLVSTVEGSNVMAATEGVETHDGAPSVSE